jgi:hypothetical protein
LSDDCFVAEQKNASQLEPMIRARPLYHAECAGSVVRRRRLLGGSRPSMPWYVGRALAHPDLLPVSWRSRREGEQTRPFWGALRA